MEINFSNLKRELILLLFYPTALFCLLLRTDSLSSKIQIQNKIRPSGAAERSMKTLTQGLLENEKFSLRDGNFLVQQVNYFKTREGEVNESNTSITNTDSCQLLQFKTEEAVACFDHHYSAHHIFRRDANIEKHILLPRMELKFLFMGDSRSRQHFYNFLRMIPDYDRLFEPNPIPPYYNNIDVISGILRLRVSFRWRPLLNKDVIMMLQELGQQNESERPFMIFLSIEVWHMLDMADAGYDVYQKRLIEVFQLLGRLANFSKVIWLNQYPTLDFYGATGAHNTKIFAEKIYHYNIAVRRILGNQTNIMIWDSANSLVEEYIRSCNTFKRLQSGPMDILDPATSYVNCQDYVHPGYSALSQATQLLYNNVCNK